MFLNDVTLGSVFRDTPFLNIAHEIISTKTRYLQSINPQMQPETIHCIIYLKVRKKITRISSTLATDVNFSLLHNAQLNSRYAYLHRIEMNVDMLA